MQEFDHILIELLSLSKRTYHALARYGIRTVRDLRQFYLDKDHVQIRNIGGKSLDEIAIALEGLHKNLDLLPLAQKEAVEFQIQESKKTETTIQSSIDALNLPPAIRGGLKNMELKLSKI